jgi:putative membrane protein
MKKYLSYIAFAILGFLLLLTILYETGSPWGVCQAWGSIIAPGSMAEMHRRHMFGYGFRGFGLLFWVLVFAFIYLLIAGDRKEEESAIDILNKRLARGEITKEEYMEMKREILGKD